LKPLIIIQFLIQTLDIIQYNLILKKKQEYTNGLEDAFDEKL